MGDLDNIFRSSDKAELIEYLEKDLETADKCIVITVEDTDDKFICRVMTLGFANKYEAYGILDVAKQDLMNDD